MHLCFLIPRLYLPSCQVLRQLPLLSVYGAVRKMRGQRLMNIIELISSLLIISGGFFFFAGTIGLLRFPDVYTRLHALTKADNLGLGLTIAGLLLATDTLTY